MCTFRIICEYVIFMISAPGLATLNFRCSSDASRRAEQRRKGIMQIGQPELELFAKMWPQNAEYATLGEICFTAPSLTFFSDPPRNGPGSAWVASEPDLMTLVDLWISGDPIATTLVTIATDY